MSWARPSSKKSISPDRTLGASLTTGPSGHPYRGLSAVGHLEDADNHYEPRRGVVGLSLRSIGDHTVWGAADRLGEAWQDEAEDSVAVATPSGGSCAHSVTASGSARWM
jgi:hypothetical protein